MQARDRRSVVAVLCLVCVWLCALSIVPGKAWAWCGEKVACGTWPCVGGGTACVESITSEYEAWGPGGAEDVERVTDMSCGQEWAWVWWWLRCQAPVGPCGGDVGDPASWACL